MENRYGFGKVVPLGFDEAIVRVTAELQKEGYALLCVSYPRSNMEVETQDEDEVYELQFGRYFAKGKVRFGLPLDEE